MAYIHHRNSIMEYILDIDRESTDGVRVTEIGRSTPNRGKTVVNRAMCNQIHFVMDGKCHVSCGGDEAELCPGKAVSIRCKEEYTESMIDTDEASSHHRHVWINYLGEPYRELPRFFAFAPYKSRIDDMFDERFRCADTINEYKLLSALYGIFALVKSESVHENSENAYIAECRRYLRENYAENIRLSDAAGHLGITPKYLSRLFRAVTGVTFGEYLAHTRLSVAEAELCKRSDTVENIARSVGFSDQFYFSRVFKKHYGVPPSEYGRKK